MMFRRLLVASFAVAALVPSACLRSKKESSVLAELQRPKLPAPQPPLPTSGGDALPSNGGVQPPKFDPKTSSIPALPGMPGTASQPLPPSSVPDVPLSLLTDSELEVRLASATGDERKGILERLRDRRQEKKDKDKPALPPAVEPKPPAPPPDALPKDPPPKPKIELRADPKPVEAKPAVDPKPTAKGELKTVRDLIAAALKAGEAMPSFEAHLTKREVVKGKEQPPEEAVYRFRVDPLSVHMRVVGEVGTGREVMWVKGQNENKMTIVTGKGDNILLGAGKKMTMDPDDPLVTAKSRYRIYEAGMQRPIGMLTKFVDQAEAGKRPADSVRYLGQVDRKEYKGKLHLVEVVLNTDDDKFLPKGGKRQYHFDADPKSPAHDLPVLVISLDHEGKEVEYYCFTDFKLVGQLTDADFDHTKVGKKK